MPPKKKKTSKRNILFQWLMIVLGFIKKVLQAVTVFLRYLWLIFPSCLFLFAAYACFWGLSQGKDLLISSLEKDWRVSILWIALIFWVFATWYSSRILVYKKTGLYSCGDDFFMNDGILVRPKKGFNINWILYRSSFWLGLHLPRIMGYLCFAIIILAYWQLPVISQPISKGTAFLFLGLNVLLYIFFNFLFTAIGKWLVRNGSKNILRWCFYISLIIFIIFIFLQHYISLQFRTKYHAHAVIVMALTFVLQQLFLFVVINRRQLITDEIKPSQQKETFVQRDMGFWEKNFRIVLRFVNVPWGERIFFLVFNGISIIAMIIYWKGVRSMSFANDISSVNFAILAFGILVGFFGLVSIFALHFKINFHIIFFLGVLFFGATEESHYIRIFKKENPAAPQRPDLKTYFYTWSQMHKDAIRQDTFPLFFILADGGASRSGYWVASVLGKFHDETNGKFDDHLFCLSGASGGSVGNAAYFDMLYNKKELGGQSYQQSAQNYLKNDFLSYTLGHMLGPDFFRPLLPKFFQIKYDRAGALEEVMEESVEDSLWHKKMAVQFSSLTPVAEKSYLPILCINTTRMQDGGPGVISNIKINDSANTFGKRIDLVSLLNNDMDINLSTAMVMGARFPYVSPAGRIDQHLKKINSPGEDSIINHYFVDGGYFDNSGAGVVHEMILGLQELRKEFITKDTQFNYLNKLVFYVIHITNSPSASNALKKVHPLQNDLMAPISTLVGSYGTQTDVNNSRLDKYMRWLYPDTTHYERADLYPPAQDSISFPMNWAISKYYQDKMKDQLKTSLEIRKLIDLIKRKIKSN